MDGRIAGKDRMLGQKTGMCVGWEEQWWKLRRLCVAEGCGGRYGGGPESCRRLARKRGMEDRRPGERLESERKEDRSVMPKLVLNRNSLGPEKCLSC